jgi:hypothetical protein
MPEMGDEQDAVVVHSVDPLSRRCGIGHAGAPRFLGRAGRCGVAGDANTPATADEAAASGRGWILLVVVNAISFSGRELLVWLWPAVPTAPQLVRCRSLT